MHTSGQRGDSKAPKDTARMVFLILMAVYTLVVLIGAFGHLSEVKICWSGC